MKIKFCHTFEEIISIENLLLAWSEFIKGKRKRKDVRLFQINLMENIILLHNELLNYTYKHGDYQAFNICDPKPRNIHKATVYDRLVHHAVHRKLYPFFDRTFSPYSFSCRLNKGTHKALKYFHSFFYKVSKNNTKTCWVLKCDIKKFFANINHEILFSILKDHIHDKNVLWLLRKIISSFNTKPGTGLPLGNLTSQLFVNIYMNEFDQFAKHKLKAKYYIRYTDDFLLFSENKFWLEEQIDPIKNFLWEKLKLNLHPKKIHLKTVASGMDFLGWVNFPNHRLLRTATKKRMMRKIKENPSKETIVSYFGLLSHGDTYKIRKNILEELPKIQKNKNPCQDNAYLYYQNKG